jgi:Cupin-like domain
MAWKVRRDLTGASSEVPFSVQGKVGRVEDPAPNVFNQRYVQANRPVVLSGVMEPWPALGRWSWPYLREVAGSCTGEVIVSMNGLYPDYVSQPSPMTKVEMGFDEFVRRAVPAAGGEPLPPVLGPGETYYLYGKSYLLDGVPALREDIGTPACLSTTPVSSWSLWISSPGCVTPLHYDLPNGFLCQVRGSKKVWLFAPSQTEALYPRGSQFPGLDNFERQSQVDILHPDREAFPRFGGAAALECTLRQGDTLFIPSNWWHEVETLEPSISVGFGFPGGTVTSELAALSDLFKKKSGGARQGAVSGMDLFRRAAEAPGGGMPDLAADPELMMEMMQSPVVQRLIQDPSMMEALVRMMAGR